MSESEVIKMKTIQEYLKECDREAIIDQYISTYLLNTDLIAPKYDGVTVGDLKDRMKIEINGLIDRLISTEPVSNEDGGILMVIHTSELGYRCDDIDIILVEESDVLSGNNEVQAYDYAFLSHAHMMTFLVADTYLTQYYLNDLIVEFLHEALLMGPKQERLQSFIKKLEKGRNDYREGRSIPFEHAIMDLEEKYGYECEIQDPDQEAAKYELEVHKMRYDRFCKEIEIRKLRDDLLKETGNNY